MIRVSRSIQVPDRLSASGGGAVFLHLECGKGPGGKGTHSHHNSHTLLTIHTFTISKVHLVFNWKRNLENKILIRFLMKYGYSRMLLSSLVLFFCLHWQGGYGRGGGIIHTVHSHIHTYHTYLHVQSQPASLPHLDVAIQLLKIEEGVPGWKLFQ